MGDAWVKMAPKDATALSGANKRPWEDLDLNPTNRQLPTVRHRAGSGTPAVPGMTASEALSPRKKKQTPAVAPLAGGSNTPLSLLMKLASRAPTWVVILDYSTTSSGARCRRRCGTAAGRGLSAFGPERLRCVDQSVGEREGILCPGGLQSRGADATA